MTAKTVRLESGSSFCDIIPARGALTTRLSVRGTDVLWMPQDFDPRDSSWPGGGLPLCFPFAGRVWRDGFLYQYDLEGTAYPMPLHGFAFASPFEVLRQSKDELHLRLQNTHASAVLYPFAFEVLLQFKLSDTGLRVSTEISNQSATGKSPMPVALGWHPYLKLYSPQSAKLETSARQYHVVTPAGAAGKHDDTSELGATPLKISEPLLKSLIFTNLEDAAARLYQASAATYEITSGPEGTFSHTVVWSNQLDQFYCVEPWMSLPDAVSTPSGCRWLNPGESFESWIQLSISE